MLNKLILILAVMAGSALPAMAAQALQAHDTIRAQVRQHLHGQLPPAQREDARIEIGRLDPRLRLPACPTPLETFATGKRSTVGAVTVGVRCTADKPWTLYVSARVVVFGEVVVAARAVPRGHAITAEDVRLARKDLSRLSYGWLTTVDEAVGKTAKRAYAPAQVLQPNQLAAPKLVRRGEQVIVRVARDGLEVSMTGKALSDGVLGEQIQVRSRGSSRVIEAEVVAAGVVRVHI